MDTQRITISLPHYIYRRLLSSVPRRGISNFVSKTLEEKLVTTSDGDPIEAFFNLQARFPKLTTEKILGAIRKGRI